MRIADNRRIVDIEMVIRKGDGYSPDWSADFFEAGSLVYDDERDVFVVDDVDYCIACAQDWASEDESYRLFVEDVTND